VDAISLLSTSVSSAAFISLRSATVLPPDCKGDGAGAATTLRQRQTPQIHPLQVTLFIIRSCFHG
jgi:hypothetical protein